MGLRKHLLYQILYIVGICLTICLSTPKAPIYAGSEFVSPKESVRLILKWHHSFQFAGYYAALQQGYYSDEGLNVDISEPIKPKLPMESVFAGQAEYGVTGTELLIARANGKPVVALAAIFQHSPTIILFRKDSGIRLPSDLIGKTVMASADDSVEVVAMLIHEGISPTQIRFIPHSWNLNDLIDKKVDASVEYITHEPNLMQLQGIEPGFIEPVDYGIDFYGDCLFTTENEIIQHPQRVRAFRSASLKGWEYAFSHIDEMIELIMKLPGVRENGIGPEHLRYQAEQMEKLVLPSLVEIGHMNEGRWNKIAETYANMGMIPKNYSLEGFVYDPRQPPVMRWIFLGIGILSGIVLLGIVSLIWNAQLRRAVFQRTQELHFKNLILLTQSEASLDAILVVGKNMEILSYNKKFQSIFNIPADILNRMNDEKVLDYVLQQMKNADEFLKRVQYLYSHSTETGFDELHLLDGRIVERYSATMIDAKGEYQGRVWYFRDISDRRKSEKALKESESKLKEVFDHSIDNIFVMDVVENKRFIMNEINPALEKYLPFSRQKIIGAFIEDTLPPEIYQPISERYRICVETGSSYQYEELADVNNIKRYFLTSLVPLKNESGEVYRIIGISRDITDRKKIENTLHKESTTLRNLIELNPYSFQLVDKNGYTIQVNRAHTQLFGAIPPKDYSVFDDPILKKLNLLDEMHRVLKGEVVRFPELCYNVKELIPESEDKPIWIRMVCFPVFNQEGETELFVMMHEDITERKKAEAALAAETERITVTLRSIGDGVITTDTNGLILMINKAAETLTGWTQSEAAGKPLAEVFRIVNEQTRQPCDNPVERVLKTGNIYELTDHSMLTAKDGTQMIIADSAAPIRDNRGQTIGVVLVFRDTTEKQRLLESSIKNQKLEALGVLAGGIAHDFNNLLTVIFGYIDLVCNTASDSAVINSLEKTKQAIYRARDLTQQLLTFSKGGEPARIAAPLFPYIKETALFGLSGSDIRLSFNIEDNLPNSLYDRNQIGQVVDNIVINAKQAMPNGGELTISAKSVEFSVNEHPTLSAGRYIAITIRDTGIGMPKETLNRVFDPFFTMKQGGHGLGLATCYSILRRHKGAIEADSEPGKGSVFTFYLPETNEVTDIPREDTPTPHRGVGQILVIDDFPVIRDLLSSMLQIMGYTVVVKDEGKTALDYFIQKRAENESFVCIITDMTIPGGMGGKEFAAEVRKIDTEIPIIVSSGYADDPVMANPSKYGFSASLRKPFQIKELAQIIGMLIPSNR